MLLNKAAIDAMTGPGYTFGQIHPGSTPFRSGFITSTRKVYDELNKTGHRLLSIFAAQGGTIKMRAVSDAVARASVIAQKAARNSICTSSLPPTGVIKKAADNLLNASFTSDTFIIFPWSTSA